MNIEEIKKSIDTDLEHITKQNELNDIKSKYLGKEGVITLLQSKIREIPNEEKKEYGIKVNEVRTYFNNLFEEVKNSYNKSLNQKDRNYTEITLKNVNHVIEIYIEKSKQNPDNEILKVTKIKKEITK